MPGQIQFSMPDFRGATRRLILWNLGAFFAVLVVSVAHVDSLAAFFGSLALRPEMFLAGQV